jgi:hypothetical protein
VLPVALSVILGAMVVLIVVEVGTAGGPGTEDEMPPRIGRDHWHASYQFHVCGEIQPPAAFWPGGVHTHDDGIIHIHPVQPSEEGRGSRLVMWFEYGGGVLTDDEVRLPGQDVTYRNGDRCPDGREGRVQVIVNAIPLEDWSEYIPQDGDHVIIVFGPDDLAGDGDRNSKLETRTLGDRTI